MKHLFYLLTFISFLVLSACGPSATSASSAIVERSFKVWGNCEQCKATIEKAGSLPGVTEVSWSDSSKILVLKTDTLKASPDAVLKAIAAAGYDNEHYIADEEAYKQLPECCQYPRRKN